MSAVAFLVVIKIYITDVYIGNLASLLSKPGNTHEVNSSLVENYINLYVIISFSK